MPFQRLYLPEILAQKAALHLRNPLVDIKALIWVSCLVVLIKGYQGSSRPQGGFTRTSQTGFDRQTQGGFDRGGMGYQGGGMNHTGFERQNFDRSGFEERGFDGKAFESNDTKNFNRSGFDAKPDPKFNYDDDFENQS